MFLPNNYVQQIAKIRLKLRIPVVIYDLYEILFS